MITAEIQKQNEMIAQYMGHDVNMGNRGLHYHDDWSWLMEVVIAINTRDYEPYHVTINTLSCEIHDDKGMLICDADSVSKERLINAVYTAVVTFIEWYNKF